MSGAAALLTAGDPQMSPAKIRATLIAHGEPGPIAGDPDRHPEPVVNDARF